jgi:hypothetical protein
MAGGITSPAQVYRHLEEKGFIDAEGSPSEKTVQRRIKELLPRIDSGAWSVLDADPEEARRVGPVLWWLFVQSRGKMWLSRSLARSVAKVRAVDDMPADWSYALGLAHEGAVVRGEADTRCLDLWLVSQPWVLLEQLTKEHPMDEAGAETWVTYVLRIHDYCRAFGEAGARQYDDVKFGLHEQWRPFQTGDTPVPPAEADDEQS